MLADTVGQATNIFTGRVTVEYVDLTIIDHLCQVIVTHVDRATGKDVILTISDHNGQYTNEYFGQKAIGEQVGLAAV